MLFPIFIVMTLFEIYVLVSVGESIGGLSTILLVIITALIGSTLLKQQGFSTLAKVQEKTALGQTPAFEMLEGVVIVISGILLLTPGFITDGVGLLGLMPWSRKIIINKIANNTKILFSTPTTRFSQQSPAKKPSQKNKPDNTIEGEFWEE